MNYLIVLVFSVILYVTPHLVKAIPLIDIAYDPDDDSTEYDEMPKSCQEKNLTYCFDKGDKYPYDLVEKAIRDMSMKVIATPTPTLSYKDLERMDYREGEKIDITSINIHCPSEAEKVISTPKPTLSLEDLERMDYRQGGKLRITPISSICPSESKNDLIYYIIDTKGNTRVVIQSPKLRQMYTLRQCINERPIKTQTKQSLSNSKTLENYDLQCKTSKMQVNFFVLNDDDYYNPKVECVKIMDGIPAGCKCI